MKLLVGLVIGLCLCSILTDINAEVITNVALDSGWFAERGYHSQSNRNAYTGRSTSTLFGNAPEASDRYNSFLIFRIPGFTGEITSLSLNIYTRAIWSLPPDDSYEFSIYEVSTDPLDFNYSRAVGSTEGLEIFNDLGSGEQYGSFSVTHGDLNQYIAVDLSESAVAKANSIQGRLFVVGIARDYTSVGTGGANFGVAVWTQDLLTEIVVTANGEIIPEPTSATLFLLGGATLFIRRSFRRKKNA